MPSTAEYGTRFYQQRTARKRKSYFLNLLQSQVRSTPLSFAWVCSSQALRLVASILKDSTGTIPYEPFDEDLLGALLPGCKIIASASAGYNEFDIDWMTRNNIWWFSLALRRTPTDLSQVLQHERCCRRGYCRHGHVSHTRSAPRHNSWRKELKKRQLETWTRSKQGSDWLDARYCRNGSDRKGLSAMKGRRLVS